MRKIIILLALILIGAVVVFYLNSIEAPEPSSAELVAAGYFDGRNSTFSLDGNPVTLIEGIEEVPAAPGSEAKIVTEYVGAESIGDLNADGLPDTAFLVAQSAGGTGHFYYVVVALKTESGHVTTNAVLLGDRIIPRSTDISEGELRVNYLDRKQDEPMTAEPSVRVAKNFKVTGSGVLVESSD
jgi:hypothetical protein